MKEIRYDAVVIGGGSAGMAAALEIARGGFSTAIVERENELGGVLNQCIHNGFGLHYFKEDLTGPEYAEIFSERLGGTRGIDVFLETTIVDVTREEEKTVYGLSKRYGLLKIKTRSIVLAMGCRERNRGNIGIPGTRPSGIFTAGLAQRLINIEGYIPGKRVIIIGSGDIGLIMARRMTWVGAEVIGVIEIQPYPSGLTRNIVQCLNDFGIPLYLSHMVSMIYGKDRVEGVEVTPLEDGVPDYRRSFKLECDTLLLSVGLIPDNELSKKFGVALNPETGGPFVDASLMTSVEGVFACGNVLHVHDLVDWVTEESERCGRFLIDYLEGKYERKQYRVFSGANVKYVLPNRYIPSRENRFYLRTLIVKNKAELIVKLDGRVVKEKKLAHVQPSEMLNFTLGPEELDGVSDTDENRLEISIV